MKIVAFNGSPRKGGIVETLLWEALRPIEYAGHDIAKFNLNELSIRALPGLRRVRENGHLRAEGRYDGSIGRDTRGQPLHTRLAYFLLRPERAGKGHGGQVPVFWCERIRPEEAHRGWSQGRKGLLISLGV